MMHDQRTAAAAMLAQGKSMRGSSPCNGAEQVRSGTAVPVPDCPASVPDCPAIAVDTAACTPLASSAATTQLKRRLQSLRITLDTAHKAIECPRAGQPEAAIVEAQTIADALCMLLDTLSAPPVDRPASKAPLSKPAQATDDGAWMFH